MILERFQLQGRVAFVAGASAEFGEAICAALAEAGADVCVAAANGEWSELQRRVEAVGRRFLLVPGDLTDSHARRSIVEQATDHWGRLDVLVNDTGGVLSAFDAKSSRVAADEAHVQRDAAAAVEIAGDMVHQAAASMARRGRGRIVNVAPTMASHRKPEGRRSLLLADTLAALTKGLARAWASRGINVNGIVPGWFAGETAVAGEVQRIPCGRAGDPEELSAAVVFLASDAANYLHGTTIDIDGGWHCC